MNKLLLLIVIVSCIACSPRPEVDQTNKATLQAMPTLFGFSTYTNTLVSPDQKHSVLMKCAHYAGDIPHCTITFPNGNESGPGESYKWLPDNRHIVDTVGCFHDSPCAGSNIWNVIEGKRIGWFYLWYQLSTDQRTIVYAKKHWALKEDGLYHEEIYLSSMDLTTDRERDLTSCPAWAQIPEWAGVKCN